MRERILKTLMKLFAVIARPESNYEDRERIVKQFLLQQINPDLVVEYLSVFNEYYHQYQKKKSKKPNKSIALSSVKVLKICSKINQELTLQQKMIVLLRLLEFIKDDVGEVTEQELEFVDVVGDYFYIYKKEYNALKDFVISSFDKIQDSSQICIIGETTSPDLKNTLHIDTPGLTRQMKVLHIESSGMFLLRDSDNHDIYINGQVIQPGMIYIINPGAVIRSSRIRPIYYSDIVGKFNQGNISEKLTLEAKNLVYKFKGGKLGLTRMSFTQETGQLVGIMGASGSGKSTLLNLLNGNYVPHSGTVTINGIDIHKEKEKISGLIGFVSQDDILIGELTVFENLYINAQLCFGDYSKAKVSRITLEMLKTLGLYDIKDLKVGSPLNKKISGGQRKRLNIALELIREPSVLFLDEPTSGLSSRDSENIMDLLKSLALKGKLIYVVIHQPSSDIFKMFDRLMILDMGGTLIYSGDPVNSIIYFKNHSRQANRNESECPACGNVNPEQLFNIIEANILDEYGAPTSLRKRTPKDWEKYYLDYQEEDNQARGKKDVPYDLPKKTLNLPNRFKQVLIFIKRDVLSKFSNRQYLLINLIETPLMSLLLAYLIKYFDIGTESVAKSYVFSDNENLPVYIFMSVIVAIFIGLTLSAEEIIKDRILLKREKFLNLSWNSYLLSKTLILLGIGAIQAFMFVLIGNSILEIKGMFFHYWFLLFTSWAVSIMVGLNISNSLKTAVSVYILIPFLVIPNIILSGILVKYEKLNPQITEPATIPFYGELIPARWAYEALATYQFIENDYNSHFYKYRRISSQATYKKDYWLIEIKNKINTINKYIDVPEKRNEITDNFELLRTEIKKENRYFANKKGYESYIFKDIDSLNIETYRPEFKKALDNYTEKVRTYYVNVSKYADDKIDKLKHSMQETEEGRENFIKLKQDYFNYTLSVLVENKNSIDAIIEYKNELFQKINPIYQDPETNFIRAHFYAPYKKVFNLKLPTYWMNIIVLWLFVLIFYLLLYINAFKVLINSLDRWVDKLFKD